MTGKAKQFTNQEPALSSVLLIIACLHLGGTEIQTLHTARALLALRYRVQLLCLFQWDPAMRRRFESAGVTVHCLDLPHPHRYLSILWRLCRAISRLQPSIVHVQYIAPGLLSVLAARLAGVRRVLITVHQLGSVCSWREHLFFRIASRLASTTICVSHAVEESWRRPSTRRPLPRPGRTTVIHNCVDIRPPRHRAAPGPPFTIGYVGRIRQEKGVDILLRAAAILSQQRRDFRLVIVGDGPQKGECQALAASLGLEPLIEWRPPVPPEDLPELYASFHLLAVPSRQEGFGLVAAEALACGTPVVAARIGGLPEIVSTESKGRLFNPEAPEAMSEAMIALLNAIGPAAALHPAQLTGTEFGFCSRAYPKLIRGVYLAI